MKSNEELQSDVQDAIKWEPMLKAEKIGVMVKDGIVTLTGSVDNFAKKSKAETTAKNIAGVNAVVEKIEINSGNWDRVSDDDIAREIITALKWNFEVPNDKVKVSVENGWVTLDGDLAWNFQRDAAQNSIKHLNGVQGLKNKIRIKSETHDAIEKTDIECALERNWSLNEDDIDVEVSGSRVTLSGNVSSWYQKDEADRIAWNAPGVEMVINNLVVAYDYALAE